MNEHRCDKEDGQGRIDSATYTRLPQGGRHAQAICWCDYVQESTLRWHRSAASSAQPVPTRSFGTDAAPVTPRRGLFLDPTSAPSGNAVGVLKKRPTIL